MHLLCDVGSSGTGRTEGSPPACSTALRWEFSVSPQLLKVQDGRQSLHQLHLCSEHCVPVPALENLRGSPETVPGKHCPALGYSRWGGLFLPPGLHLKGVLWSQCPWGRPLASQEPSLEND